MKVLSFDVQYENIVRYEYIVRSMCDIFQRNL